MDWTVVSLSWKFPYGSGDLSDEPRAESVKSEFRFCLERRRDAQNKLIIGPSCTYIHIVFSLIEQTVFAGAQLWLCKTVCVPQ